MTGSLPQGHLGLLDTPLAQELLTSRIPARMAFVWPDGTPRLIPTWFHWNGREIVMATYTSGLDVGIRHPAARLAALRAKPAVALTIDTDDAPPRCLTIRGVAEITEVDGLAEEYAAAARRYLGDDAEPILTSMNQPGTRQARIVVRPSWVGLVDFTTRLPSVLGGVLS
jgi:hypothetical protein